MISSKIVADSVGPNNCRITTFVLTYPRFIHSEIMTHRVFSRNAASSRAIPIKKMIKNIFNEPAMPVSWGQNCKGMQSKKELSKSKQMSCKILWMSACYFACGFSWLLSKLGAHKQLANRITEPFAHMTTIVTATEWENFFVLRAHPDAQPEFQVLAFDMLEKYKYSVPQKLNYGEWHLPFSKEVVSAASHRGNDIWNKLANLSEKDWLKVVTAMCARVSYLNFEGGVDLKKDFALHDELLKSGHMSPFEHAAQAQRANEKLVSGNFIGFNQYRKTFENESRKMNLR